MQKTIPSITQDALAIWNAGVAAVDAETACRNSIHYETPYLLIDDQEYKLAAKSKIVIVGAGKAARGMLTGVYEALQHAGLEDKVYGWVNVPGEGPTENFFNDRLFIHPSRPLGSNLPTHSAMVGTRKIIALLQQCNPEDVVLCLLSGGGSSLLVDPISELTLENKTKLTQALSMAGANIHQLNVVRRALSKVKGGGLLRACRADQLATLVISDVLNDDLATIASGPTIASASVDPLAAIEIVQSLLGDKHPMSTLIRMVLNDSSRQQLTHQPSKLPSHHQVHVLANNATAVDAAGTKAVELGYRYMMYCHRESEGDAGDVGLAMVKNLMTLQQSSQVDCEIVGGEPTVNMQEIVDRGDTPGRGGRNQHVVACAAAELLEQMDHVKGLEFCLLSGGTDGEDGNSSSAGAWIDHTTIHVLLQQKPKLLDACRRFDSGSLFEELGTTIDCGLTGTNVCDLRVMLIRK